MSDAQIDELDRQFAESAGEAFAAAGKESLSAGLSVVYSDNGVIYRLFPDGKRVRIKEIEPPVPVQKGLVIHLK